MIEYLDIGKVVNTHGVKGELKVMPLTDDPLRYSLLKYVLIDKDGKLEEYKIDSVRFHKNFVLLKLSGLETLEEAEKLKSRVLKIHRKDAVKLPEGSYFICDLIGIKVLNMNGSKLGTLKDVIKTGGNDVYVVQHEEKELLIPALKSVVKNIDLNKREMLVDLPEGLL